MVMDVCKSKADEERARELLHALLQYPDFYAEELVEKDLQLVLAALAAVREEVEEKYRATNK